MSTSLRFVQSPVPTAVGTGLGCGSGAADRPLAYQPVFCCNLLSPSTSLNST